ncbi:MAG: apolipoprotein N-acyltransferase [Proteobacteria bacterium]|nr:apolipoprotein N-acyltransferase [Pseudomonadota bacterium]
MGISLLLACLSGALYVFSFAPWDHAWLQWAAFVPLFLSIELLPESRKNARWIFGISLIPAMIICVGGFYWVVHATQEYGGLPLGAALALFVLFMLTGQLQIPVSMLLRRLLLESPIPLKSTLLFAVSSGLVYAGVESLYPKLFLDTAGHAFYHSPWVRQAADIGGPFLLTTLVLTVNELLYLALRTRSPRPAFYAGLIGAALCIYGQVRITQYENLKVQKSDAPVFNVAMIQANIGDYLKVAAERGTFDATEQVMNRYLGMSAAALANPVAPDAVIWPETAFPALFQRPKSRIEELMQNRFDGLLEKSRSHFIFGGYDLDERKGEEYNALYFYDPGTRTRDAYHKSILLMFGETLPLSETFPSMKSWFPTMGFFGRGPGPALHTLKNRSGTPFRFAPSICYEGLFTSYAVEGALQGADALLNVTNDSWFGEYGEPYLHLALTQFRSIETRLPLLRATNTGITVMVSPLGETPKQTGISKEDTLTGSITPRIMPESPYMALSRVFGVRWFERLTQIFALVLTGYLTLRRSQLSKN